MGAGVAFARKGGRATSRKGTCVLGGGCSAVLFVLGFQQHPLTEESFLTVYYTRHSQFVRQNTVCCRYAVFFTRCFPHLKSSTALGCFLGGSGLAPAGHGSAPQSGSPPASAALAASDSTVAGGSGRSPLAGGGRSLRTGHFFSAFSRNCVNTSGRSFIPGGVWSVDNAGRWLVRKEMNEQQPRASRCNVTCVSAGLPPATPIPLEAHSSQFQASSAR